MPSLRSSVADQFGGLSRQVWILFAGTVVSRLGYLVTPFLVFYLASRGISAEQTPYILGALGAGHLIGPMLGGLLADRLGRRPTMLIGLVGNATANGALFVAPGVVTLALAALALTMAGAMVGPAAYAVLADTVAPERRRSPSPRAGRSGRPAGRPRRSARTRARRRRRPRTAASSRARPGTRRARRRPRCRR